MTELFQIEPTVPKWRELAEVHGITTSESIPGNPITEIFWAAHISWFGKSEFAVGRTEKEAVVSLIHRLKLTGWETVSL